MIFASKSTLSINTFKILRPKVTKILRICLTSFVNFHPEMRLATIVSNKTKTETFFQK